MNRPSTTTGIHLRLLHARAPLVYLPVIAESLRRHIRYLRDIEFRCIRRELGHAMEEATVCRQLSVAADDCACVRALTGTLDPHCGLAGLRAAHPPPTFG
jgi:hypothetical protein